MNNDDITRNQKELPLPLPSCWDIKRHMAQIETPRELWEFLQDKHKRIYDSCNFGNEPSFFDIIREVAIRIRGKHLSLNLPLVPSVDDMVAYKNWCIDAQKVIAPTIRSLIWRRLKKAWKFIGGVVVFLAALFACIHYWPEIHQKLLSLFPH